MSGLDTAQCEELESMIGDLRLLGRVDTIPEKSEFLGNLTVCVEQFGRTLNSEISSTNTQFMPHVLPDSITGKKLNKDRLVFYLNQCISILKCSHTRIRKMYESYNDSDDVKEPESEPCSDCNDAKEENALLKNEALVDKRKIIDLQQTIIDQAGVSANEMKATVKAELMSYSAVVKSTCSAALAPKKLGTAIKKVTEWENARDLNIMVYGVVEDQNEDLSKAVSTVFEEIGEKPKIVTSTRLGIKKEGTIRPIKCTLSSSTFVNQIMKNAAKLRESESFSRVYLSPDRTLEEREKRRELVNQYKLKLKDSPDIKYRMDFKSMRLVLVEQS